MSCSSTHDSVMEAPCRLCHLHARDSPAACLLYEGLPGSFTVPSRFGAAISAAVALVFILRSVRRNCVDQVKEIVANNIMKRS
jgi:hypothetical protein